MDIFEDKDLVSMTLTNTTNQYYSICNRVVKPNEEAKTLCDLGISMQAFKTLYQEDDNLQSWFNQGFLVSKPITKADRDKQQETAKG